MSTMNVNVSSPPYQLLQLKVQSVTTETVQRQQLLAVLYTTRPK